MTPTAAGRDFFASRWAPRPAHVTDLGRGLPAGFRAAAASAGIKGGSALDVGLLVCDADEPVSAARYTRSGVLAAPVLVTRDETDPGALRAIVANSGNANAATGRDGLLAARAMQRAAGQAIAAPPRSVAVASTGVIGVPLA
ncbi:MAG TPA: bifunctional ornithine acetyltransferase/N-acetylglutamate synthase, partial [Solirubrobacteraceae bacterium]|nr:bifunctional ornithine acetyltransferase/N-acetylglutamate synthase [Solirubrobacteraceae bacterium]